VCVCVCVCANAAATTMTTIVTFGSIKSVNFLWWAQIMWRLNRKTFTGRVPLLLTNQQRLSTEAVN